MTPRAAVPKVGVVQVVMVDAWMNLKTAAAYGGMNPEKLRQKACMGLIPGAGKYGHHWKFKREGIDSYFQGNVRA